MSRQRLRQTGELLSRLVSVPAEPDDRLASLLVVSLLQQPGRRLRDEGHDEGADQRGDRARRRRHLPGEQGAEGVDEEHAQGYEDRTEGREEPSVFGQADLCDVDVAGGGHPCKHNVR